MRRGRLAGMVGITAVLCVGCGSAVSTVPGPSPTPTSPPSTLLRQDASVGIGAPDLMFVGFEASAAGKLQAILDWTQASNAVSIVGIAAGAFPACSALDFRADPWVFVKSGTSEPCPFLATTETVDKKPAKLTTVSTAAGSYTFILGSRGPNKDLVSWQIYSIPNP